MVDPIGLPVGVALDSALSIHSAVTSCRSYLCDNVDVLTGLELTNGAMLDADIEDKENEEEEEEEAEVENEGEKGNGDEKDSCGGTCNECGGTCNEVGDAMPNEGVEDEEGASRTNVFKVGAAVTVDRKAGKRMLSCAASPLKPAIVPGLAVSDIAMQGRFGGKGCKH